MQVLLVEDDLTWAGSVEQMLRKSGHACVVVNMAKPAVELAKTGSFDLIILDIMLPDLDGYEVMEQLKEAGCATPVLVQSGLIDKSGQDDAHAFGAAEVLIKPYGHLELIEAMVKVLLPGPMRTAAGGQSEVELEAATIRELFDRLGAEYPKLKPVLDKGVTVAIDGELYQDALFQSIPPDSEVVILPRMAGG